MDEIDLILMRKLLKNARMTFRELADITNMSVSAVYKRINNLIDDEIIEAFISRPSFLTLKYLTVTIFGTSKAKSMDAISKELEQHENIYGIVIASGKFLMIVGLLRDISELQEFSVFVSRTAQFDDSTIGIVNLPFITTPEPLTSIDYKILKTLNRDSRKPMTDIADDVGLSVKTVRKRLDRMRENNLAIFTIETSFKAENNLTTVFLIYLNEGTDINSTLQYLYEKYSRNVIYVLSYSNIPNFLMMFVWTKTAQDSQKIQEELQTEGFKDIVPHIFFSLKYYDCWIDQLLRTK
ncbi:MAG: AsnC family transcriptional regulator [Candidatus Lokiarchaeota archaeon]|nr:AsnC family transcriptional regulator [Candidatus Lokiarchaeota archaeon]